MNEPITFSEPPENFILIGDCFSVYMSQIIGGDYTAQHTTPIDDLNSLQDRYSLNAAYSTYGWGTKGLGVITSEFLGESTDEDLRHQRINNLKKATEEQAASFRIRPNEKI